MLTITHTALEGTTVDGTSRGDGAGELLKRHGFRWSRNVGCWFLRNSRGRLPLRHTIDAAAATLRAAGFEVAIDIEETTAAEREDARAAVLAEKIDYKAERAEALHAKAAGEYGKARQIMDTIPSGQPILVGHHSERRHRKDISRIDSAIGRSADASRKAEAAERGATSAARELAGLDDLVKIGRKIDRLAADERKMARALAAPDRSYADADAEMQARVDAWREQTAARLADVREELEHLRGKVAAAEEAGAKVYSRADIEVGDLVLIRHGWCKVAKANPKTVACEVGMPWPLKYEYYEVRGLRKPAAETTTEEAA